MEKDIYVFVRSGGNLTRYRLKVQKRIVKVTNERHEEMANLIEEYEVNLGPEMGLELAPPRTPGRDIPILEYENEQPQEGEEEKEEEQAIQEVPMENEKKQRKLTKKFVEIGNSEKKMKKFGSEKVKIKKRFDGANKRGRNSHQI